MIDYPEVFAPWTASLRTHLHEAFGANKLRYRALDLLSCSLTAPTLKSFTGKLTMLAELRHDSENDITPSMAATTAIILRYVT